MIKRLIWIVAVIFCIMLLCSGCQHEPYEIFEENGNCYIRFTAMDAEQQKSDAEAQIASVGSWPCFSSVADMKRKIETGDIPEDGLMRMRASAEDGILQSCDLNNLYDITAPSDLELKFIRWKGLTYNFHFSDFDKEELIVMDLLTEEKYKQKFEYYYQDFPQESMHEILYSKAITDRNATETRYRNETGEYTSIAYEIVTEGKILYVKESYILSNDAMQQYISETIPYTVELFCNEEGAYLYGWLFNLGERPSVEWLSQFGLRKFEG